MAEHKRPRLGSSVPETASSLIRHWHILREPLFPYLTTHDLIALFWTHRTLEDDVVIGQRVFEETNEYATHLLLGCPRDWCAPVRVLDWECPDQHQCRHYHGHGHYASDDPNYHVPRPTNLAEMMRTWQAKLGSRERCASLLSLACLMATELEELLYSRETPMVTTYTIVPFILPLSHLDAIARTNPPPGSPTRFGFHFENHIGGESGTQVRCALCDACVTTEREPDEYWDRREQENQAFYQQLRDDGYERGSSEYEARANEHEARKVEQDEYYQEYNFHAILGLVITDRCEEGKLPPLHLSEEMMGEEWYYAVDSRLYGGSYRAEGFCESRLRPVTAFFRRNGFGQMHRASRERNRLGGDKGEVCRVEMVGAAAPHGFFAGVYYVGRHA